MQSWGFFSILKTSAQTLVYYWILQFSTEPPTTWAVFWFNTNMRRYYFVSKKNPDLFLYIDTQQEVRDSWCFYELKEKRIYASPYHEKKYQNVHFIED